MNGTVLASQACRTLHDARARASDAKPTTTRGKALAPCATPPVPARALGIARKPGSCRWRRRACASTTPHGSLERPRARNTRPDARLTFTIISVRPEVAATPPRMSYTPAVPACALSVLPFDNSVPKSYLSVRVPSCGRPYPSAQTRRLNAGIHVHANVFVCSDMQRDTNRNKHARACREGQHALLKARMASFRAFPRGVGALTPARLRICFDITVVIRDFHVKVMRPAGSAPTLLFAPRSPGTLAELSQVFGRSRRSRSSRASAGGREDVHVCRVSTRNNAPH